MPPPPAPGVSRPPLPCQVVTMLVADRLQSVHGIAWAVASAMCYVVYVQWSDALTEQVGALPPAGGVFGSDVLLKRFGCPPLRLLGSILDSVRYSLLLRLSGRASVSQGRGPKFHSGRRIFLALFSRCVCIASFLHDGFWHSVSIQSRPK